MLYFAEADLIQSIGSLGIVGSVLPGLWHRVRIDVPGTGFWAMLLPGQCQTFLTTSKSFVWFIEQRDVVSKSANDVSFNIPLVTLQNKKIYPAKVNGINLALLGSSNTPTLVTTRWREGLIRYDNRYDSSYHDSITPCLRPGFGQTILTDLQRPLESETVITNNLGLTDAFANSRALWGPLGRLMSMAFYVEKEIAAKYDASNSKKKKKSPNSQDYQENPTYPAYTPFVDNGGY